MAAGKAQKTKGWRLKIDLGPLSILFWGVIILFFMGWIFVLGIFVGRGVVPEKITDISEIKGEIIKLKKPIAPETTEEAQPASSDDTGEKDLELVFFNQLTSKKDEAKNSIQKEETPVKGSVSAAQGTKSEKVKSPAGTTAKSGSGKYTVQVASISELASAEKIVKELLEKGFDAYYYETKVNGKIYYRIRCGRFSDRAEAQKYSTGLEKKTGLKGYVTDVE